MFSIYVLKWSLLGVKKADEHPMTRVIRIQTSLLLYPVKDDTCQYLSQVLTLNCFVVIVESHIVNG